MFMYDHGGFVFIERPLCNTVKCQEVLLKEKNGYSKYVNIALLRFLHDHDNIATEGSPKPGLCPTLIWNDSKGSL